MDESILQQLLWLREHGEPQEKAVIELHSLIRHKHLNTKNYHFTLWPDPLLLSIIMKRSRQLLQMNPLHKIVEAVRVLYIPKDHEVFKLGEGKKCLSFQERQNTLDEFRGTLSDPFPMIIKLTEALALIHDQRCVHANLSLHSVLIASQDEIKLQFSSLKQKGSLLEGPLTNRKFTSYETGLAYFYQQYVVYDFEQDAWALGLISALILIKNSPHSFKKIYNMLPSLKCHFQKTYFIDLVHEIRNELNRSLDISQEYITVIVDGLLAIEKKERLGVLQFMKFLIDFNKGILHPFHRIQGFSEKRGVIQNLLSIQSAEAITEISNKIITFENLKEEIKTQIQIDILNIASLQDLLCLTDVKEYSSNYELYLPQLEPKKKVQNLFNISYEKKQLSFFNLKERKKRSFRTQIAFNSSGLLFTNLQRGSLVSLGGFSSISLVETNYSHLNFHVQASSRLKCTWYSNLPELRICSSGVGLTKFHWIVVGGFNQRFKNSRPYSLLFNAIHNQWKYAPPLKTRRNKPALVTMPFQEKDYLFAFGGEREPKTISVSLTDSTMESTCEALKVEYFERRRSGAQEWQILKFNSGTSIRHSLSLNNYIAIQAINGQIFLFGSSPQVLIVNLYKFNEIRAKSSPRSFHCFSENIGGYTGSYFFSTAIKELSNGSPAFVQIDLLSGEFGLSSKL